MPEWGYWIVMFLAIISIILGSFSLLVRRPNKRSIKAVVGGVILITLCLQGLGYLGGL